MDNKQIWIVDFGSQYTQLITRKSRELGYYSEIVTLDETKKRFKKKEFPKALVLSGGPQSIFEDKTDYSFLFNTNTDLPILGICYGMQLLSHYFEGEVEKGVVGEYGHCEIELKNSVKIDHCPRTLNVWMSHSDHISKPPENFKVIMESHNGLIAGIKHKSLPIMGLQFHPEVEHTDHGKEILNYFYESIACLSQDWTPAAMLEEAFELIKSVGKANVLCAFSGGVDSLVAATIADKVLGAQVYCFFIDTGLLRPQDLKHIEMLQEKTNLNIEIVDASAIFFKNLQGVSDPEKKRKVIGNTFIDVFEKKVHEFENNKKINFTHLLQGTLYPDVIESISPHKKGGKSVTIKSHHNVGGLPEKMKLKLVEPLRYLFKDEVRALGKELELDPSWVYRHPFPGPGIGVRVLGELKPDSVRKVQDSDQILFEEMHNFSVYDSVWQAFTVLLPVKTVGVKGDARAYEEVICIRIVNSVDGMTATWSDLPRDFLVRASSRITNEVSGITRCVYDITSKPPGTIEWE